MSRRLLLSRSPGETRAALVDDGRLVDFEVHRDHAPGRVGGIYLGRLRKVTGDGRSAFAEIGDGEALVDLDPQSAAVAGWRYAEGALVPVQITQDARRGRLPRGTTRTGVAGPRLVFLPHGEADGVSHRIADPEAKRAVRRELAEIDRPVGAFVARAGAVSAGRESLYREAAALVTEWRSCADRLDRRTSGSVLPPPAPGVALLRDAIDPATDIVAGDDRATLDPLAAFLRAYFAEAPVPETVGLGEMAKEFEGLEDHVETALTRRVALPGGGSVTIERTEGMTAVDVDAGSGFGVPTAADARGLNQRAAVEVARQLRLRGLGGLCAVDLAGRPRGKAAAAVMAAFREGFRDDPARTEIDLSEAQGVALVSRQWSRAPLEEIVAASPARTDGPVAESLETIVLRALRQARLAAASVPMARQVIHLSAAAAQRCLTPSLAAAVSELTAATGLAPRIAAHDDWPDERVEIADQ